MTAPTLIEENEQVAFYIANSWADELSPEVKKPALIFYRNAYGNLTKSIPSTLNEAIDVFTSYKPEFEVLFEKYGHLQYNAINFWQNGEKDLRYDLGHMCGEFFPREPNARSEYSLLDFEHFSALKNSPTEYLSRFHEFSCLNTFLREYTFVEERKFGGYKYSPQLMGKVITAQNLSELEQLMDNSSGETHHCLTVDQREKPYRFFKCGKGKAKWFGLDLWFPNEQERLDRIKRFINGYWPNEFRLVAEDINKLRDWIKSLKSE